jgi:hypothetical protein
VDSRKFPGHRWPEDVIDEAKNPRVQRTPYGIDRGSPISMKVGIANVKIAYAISIHRLAFNGGIHM